MGRWGVRGWGCERVGCKRVGTRPNNQLTTSPWYIKVATQCAGHLA